MTNAEAIEILKSRRMCAAYVDSKYVDSVDIEVIDMAISALEKQEGKGPVAVNAKSTWVKCPVCGSTDIDEYCEKCGQRIDWSDEHGTD